MKVTETKKILVLINGSYVSGAEKVTIDIIQGLKKAGHNIFCVTSGWADGNFARLLENIRVPYKPIKLGWYYLSRPKWTIDSLLNYPKALKLFLKLVKHYQYDLVYTISYRFIFLLYPFLQKKVIYHVHEPCLSIRQSRFFINLVDSKVVKYIAVSEFIKNDLIACGILPHKVEVIHNGVEILDLPVQSKVGGKRFVIGIVGQILPRKGHEDVLKCLELLRERKLDITLMVVGKAEGKYADRLKGIISNSGLSSYVEWRGFASGIYNIYEAIDLVVAPTRNEEPFALVALEANLLSIPIIATNVGGFPEFITDGFNGFLVTPNNPVELAEKIEILYSNHALTASMGKNGRNRVLENFTKVKMIDRMEKLLQSLM